MKEREKRKVTIQDIAKELGISPSTVSRSLNNNSKISDETKQKVYQTALELGYHSSIPGLFEQNKKRKSICIIVPNLQNSLYINVIDNIQKELNEYNCFVSSSLNCVAKEKELVESYLEMGIDGVFISLCDSNDIDHIENVANKEIPLVLFNNVNFDVEAQKIVIDNFQGAYKAVEHLVSMNCGNIVLVKGDDEDLLSQDLYEGYVSALKHLDLEIKEENVHTLSSESVNYGGLFDKLLNTGNICDGIIFSDNDLAMRFIATAKKNDISIPQDMRIVCYGNEKYNEFLSPSISTIECSSNKIASLVVKSFLEQTKLKERVTNSLVVPTKIIIRSSSIRV